ncbi:hypothetical protein LINPERPRIM_LOCUS2354 [Linum perenne]
MEYPTQLDFWNYAHGTNLCYMRPSRLVNVSCQDNSVTRLRIMGDKPSWLDNHTLSPSFSMDSFGVTLARLNSSRVLSLVSLGDLGSSSGQDTQS